MDPLQELSPVVEALKAEGMAVVVVAGRYEEPETRFCTQLALNDAVGEDLVVRRALTACVNGPETSDDLHNLFQPVRESLVATTAQLAEEGWSVVLFAIRRMPDGRLRWASRVSTGRTAVAQDHIRCDLAREVAVEWSNKVHAAQLVWQEPAPAGA